MQIVHDIELKAALDGGYHLDGMVAEIDGQYYAYIYDHKTGQIRSDTNEFARHNENGVKYAGKPFKSKRAAVAQVNKWKRVYA